MGDDNRSAKLLQYSREREEQGENNAEINLREKLADENKKLWVVAAPPIFTRFSTFGVGVISQAFIGHIGPTEPAAYALVGTVVLRLANGLLGCARQSFRTCSSSSNNQKDCFKEQNRIRNWGLLACSYFDSKHGICESYLTNRCLKESSKHMQQNFILDYPRGVQG
ncbi:protein DETOXIFICATION 21-like isoform X1 [Asparagus officinalis]|uniref:protein DETOXIFICATION 21-like isoform X1 n=1 Tax=Asparagus officinalis TaxID=4686 RepID=UPI00098E491A|nr:protein DETOXIFICATION 21-like isoform X1 [Asparagus officinalis]XP_020260869.1 protein DETOXIFICATION 21-like isoform X1 [Asparagus officinalis]